MIAELGLFALILALVAALFLAVVPMLGVYKQRNDWMQAAKLYVWGQFIFIGVAYLCLTWCFLSNDFSVLYVVSNSSVLLPWFYKLCAVWGGHEGSMLLWVAILSLWMVLVCTCSSSLEQEMWARVLVVLGWISVGLFCFY